MEINDALQAAIDAVRQAGQVVLSYYTSQYEVRDKSPDNPVTTADIAADQVLHEMLQGAVPAAGWLSEETADNPRRLQQEMVWVVDPIDGTREFIQGIDEFVVVVALVIRQQVVLAVTYNPVRRELIHACHGHGAFCNGNRIRVTTTARLQDAVTLASRSEVGRGEFEPFKEVLTIRPVGSVANKLAQVAKGTGDMTFSLVPKNEWDICAGTLLITEAGGRVTDRQGQPFLFNQPDTLRTGIIATNGWLHEQVLRLTRERSGDGKRPQGCRRAR
jgi:myo-inositol-1(or 4)-monophosphatase